MPVKAEGVDNADLTNIVFQGIFDFQNLWILFQKDKPDIAQECIKGQRETLMILHRLIDMPRKSEAELLAGFEADTNFGTSYKKGIITKEHLDIGKKMGVEGNSEKLVR